MTLPAMDEVLEAAAFECARSGHDLEPMVKELLERFPATPTEDLVRIVDAMQRILSSACGLAEDVRSSGLPWGTAVRRMKKENPGLREATYSKAWNVGMAVTR